MAFWWIENGQVVAIAPEIDPPGNITVVEGVDAESIDLVWFDGESVVLRGDRPGPEYYWDPVEGWRSPPEAPPLELSVAEKIAALEGRLRNTAVWAHVWNAMLQTTRANGCVTFLLQGLTVTRNPNDVIWGFNQLRLAMQEQASLTDFSAEHLSFVGEQLDEIGLELPGLNLEPSP